MSAEWADLGQALPGLRGNRVHVVDATLEAEVRAALQQAGFEVRTLDGTRIGDELGFLQETARGLALPPHFGKNWAALDDCLSELTSAGGRLAIVWRDADRCAEASLQTLLDGVAALDRAAALLALDDPDLAPLQIEIFLLGIGRGFGTIPRE